MNRNHCLIIHIIRTSRLHGVMKYIEVVARSYRRTFNVESGRKSVFNDFMNGRSLSQTSVNSDVIGRQQLLTR